MVPVLPTHAEDRHDVGVVQPRRGPGLAVEPQQLPGMAQAIAVVLLHTGAMVAVMGSIALLVYEKLGLAILRSAWINLDTIWAGALLAAGVISFAI